MPSDFFVIILKGSKGSLTTVHADKASAERRANALVKLYSLKPDTLAYDAERQAFVVEATSFYDR